MSNLIRKPTDFVAGMAFLLVALFAIYLSSGFGFGSLRRIGPGLFPLLLAGLLLIFAMFLIVGSLLGERVRPQHSIAIRPAVLVLSAPLLFAVLLRPLGLVVATMVLVVFSSAAGMSGRLRHVAILAVALALGGTLIFVYALGQPIPVLGTWIDQG